MPTEAQWEYACRAETQTSTDAGALAVYDDGRDHDLDEVAWYDLNSEQQPHDVGEKQPNKWGLYDMLGNVWEWCRDGVRNYDNQHATDPEHLPESTSAGRVIRGGGWGDSALVVRAAYRDADRPGVRDRDLGSRCSVQVSPEGSPVQGHAVKHFDTAKQVVRSFNGLPLNEARYHQSPVQKSLTALSAGEEPERSVGAEAEPA